MSRVARCCRALHPVFFGEGFQIQAARCAISSLNVIFVQWSNQILRMFRRQEHTNFCISSTGTSQITNPVISPLQWHNCAWTTLCRLFNMTTIRVLESSDCCPTWIPCLVFRGHSTLTPPGCINSLDQFIDDWTPPKWVDPGGWNKTDLLTKL